MVPKVRFKGFTDEWEQRKLGDVTDIKTGSRNHQDSVENGKYPFFVRSEKIERLDEYDFDTKAILIPGDGRIGEIFHYYDGKFALHQRVYKVDNFNGIDALFLLSLFRYSFRRHALRLNAQGTVPSLRLPMFTKWEILLPKLEEQEKIGQLFQFLDKTITLHEEQHRQLEQLKKALLQKMFADETGYPALRFKGFTEKWEQRKLGETVVNTVAGGDINKAELLSKGKYPVYANALTNNGIVGYYASQYRIAAPAVTVTGRGDIGIAKARDINFTPVVRLLAISSQHNNYFLENLINTHRSFAESTGVPQLTVPQLSNYKLYFPQKINEEVFIGKLFKKMDHLTTLHQHKIDNLKRLKRALLQKMFV